MFAKIKSLIKLTVWRWLLRVLFFLRLASARSAADIAKLARFLVCYELRKLDEKMSIPGDFVEDDYVIAVVAANFLKQNLHESLREAELRNQERITELLEKGKKSEEVRRAVAYYYLVWKVFYEISQQDSRALEALSDARVYVPAIEPIKLADLARIKREIRRRLSKLEAELSDRYGFKLDIAISDIAGLAAVWSVLFLISGYFYTSTLLGALGVDASIFLGVSDYVSASIDQIKYAGFATAWGAFIYFSGAFHGSRKSVEQRRRETPTNDRIYALFWVLVAVLVIACIYTYFIERRLFYINARFAGILLSMAAADWLGSRVFTKSLPAAAFLTAFFTFFVHIVTAVGEQIYKVDSKTWVPSMKAMVVVVESGGGRNLNGDILLGAGNIFFIIDKDANKIIALPKDRVQQINIEPRRKNASNVMPPD